MIRYLFFLISIIIGFSSFQVFANDDDYDYRYLKEPSVTWEDGRLTGEIENVPVEVLLEELAWKKNFQLEIFGDINQDINISFDHHTLEESIKKIMRITHLSHVLISDAEKRSKGEVSYCLSELIVFARGERIRSAQNRPLQSVKDTRKLTSREEIVVSLSQEAAFEKIKPPKNGSRRINATFEGNLDDFKIYVEEIAKKGGINSQEYETILNKMNKENR